MPMVERAAGTGDDYGHHCFNCDATVKPEVHTSRGFLTGPVKTIRGWLGDTTKSGG
ncbi:hypothetical protein M404DRAFT_1006723, partial [Pisolithus tinctorius Marx 270]